VNEPVGHSPRPRDHLDYRAFSVSAGINRAGAGRSSATGGLVDDETGGIGSWNGVAALHLDWIWARDGIVRGAAGRLRRALAVPGKAQLHGEVAGIKRFEVQVVPVHRSFQDPVFRAGDDWESQQCCDVIEAPALAVFPAELLICHTSLCRGLAPTRVDGLRVRCFRVH